MPTVKYPSTCNGTRAKKTFGRKGGKTGKNGGGRSGGAPSGATGRPGTEEIQVPGPQIMCAGNMST